MRASACFSLQGFNRPALLAIGQFSPDLAQDPSETHEFAEQTDEASRRWKSIAARRGIQRSINPNDSGGDAA